MTLLNLMMAFNPMYVVVFGKKQVQQVLMHVRHKKWAKRNLVLSEKALRLDFQIGKKKFESLQHMPQVIQGRILVIFSDTYIVHA